MKKLNLKGVTKHGQSYRYRYEVKLALGMVSKRSRVLCKVTEPYAVIMEHYNRVLNEVDSETKFNVDDLYNLYKTKPGYEDREVCDIVRVQTPVYKDRYVVHWKWNSHRGHFISKKQWNVGQRVWVKVN